MEDKAKKNQINIELKEEVGWKRLILRKNYGERIEQHFNMTRQGVRWRFQRLMDMYVSAYETILFVESNFSIELRNHAMAIAKERTELRRKAQKIGRTDVHRR